VSMVSVEQTTRELIELVEKCGTQASGAERSAREVAEIAHRAAAGLLAVVEHPRADPALLFGVLVATRRPVGQEDTTALREHVRARGADLREVIHSRSPRGYPVVFAERTVHVARLRAGEPFECQLQAVVADPARPCVAVFTLSSTTGRGWLELSRTFGRLVASVDFAS
jgi:hypothetical protein